MRFPLHAKDLNCELLTEVLQDLQPGIAVTAFDSPQLNQCGDGQASTADRITLTLRFAGSIPADMPQQMMLKTMLVSPHAPAEMYENEVRFYREIRPQLDLETPRVFASHFDRASGQFGILMEDLSLRQAWFPNATCAVSIEQIKSILHTLACLHGRFWQSPLLETDLSWVATPVSGGMSDFFRQYGFDFVADQVNKHSFKQELIKPLGMGLEHMHERMTAFQNAALQYPQTLLHGDTHIANTYLTPDGKGGLYDWQLMVRGNWAHDVAYVIATGLSTVQRRQYEKELLRYYLDLLQQQNLDQLPDPSNAWDLYRHSLMWSLFIGWLITPPSNYGEDITRANISKLVTAANDLGSFSF